ncbi:hypothetical protein L5F23_01675 [Aliarcobacter butzleri]|uniref:hypothetical protein n=1 Tax=Aliarcobacter butzleri TaxID=28197 RepID=UPI001ED9F5E0|nr:hypothetical protein [Aliarcobacter butzleri]MCG3655410.1 hypothetical protein [Aliarcobacter butzleri]
MRIFRIIQIILFLLLAISILFYFLEENGSQLPLGLIYLSLCVGAISFVITYFLFKVNE